MKLVDVHSHIHLQVFDKDRELVLSKARGVGVVAVITSTLRYSEIPEALRIIQRYPRFVFLSVGLDPMIFDPLEIQRVMEFIEQSKDILIAIGEVGLDYALVKRTVLREVQKQNLIRWIKLAEELNLPLIIHSRHAGKIAVKVLLELGYPKVVLHAFDGDIKDAQIAEELGLYFSIPPSVLYSKQKQQLVSKVNLERILLESDAPLLGPARNLRNEPSNIVKVVGKIAEIKDVSISEVARVTTNNAKALLGRKLPLS